VTHLTIEAELLGVPGTVVVAPTFVTAAKMTGANRGVPVIRTSIYPNAFELDTDEQLRDNMEKIVLPQIIDNLTKAIDASEYTDVKKPVPTDIVLTGTLDKVCENYAALGFSDGMTITPPTIDRVQEFLKYTDLAPDAELTIVSPSLVRATPWNVAVNGVMAGCKPE